MSGIAQPRVSGYESARESPTTRTMARLLDVCETELRLTGRRIPADQMGRGALRSLENHRKIAATLLADEETRRRLVGHVRDAMAEARVADPFGELWGGRWGDLPDGPLDEFIATLVGEDRNSGV
jgi:hypothetical protein